MKQILFCEMSQKTRGHGVTTILLSITMKYNSTVKLLKTCPEEGGTTNGYSYISPVAASPSVKGTAGKLLWTTITAVGQKLEHVTTV